MNRESILRWLSEAAVSRKHGGEADLIGFLGKTAREDIPLFLDTGWLQIYSVLLPLGKLKGSYVSELLSWNTRERGVWGFTVGSNAMSPVPLCVNTPLDMAGEVLSSGEPLTELWRLQYGAGVDDLDISRDFMRSNGLAYDRTTGGYIVNDGRWGGTQAVSVYTGRGTSMVTVRGDLMRHHLEGRGMALVRLVEGVGSFGFGGEERTDTIINRPREGLFIRLTMSGEGTWARGIHIIKPRPTLRGGVRPVEMAAVPERRG